jgi:hypothetical protein
MGLIVRQSAIVADIGYELLLRLTKKKQRSKNNVRIPERHSTRLVDK